MHLGRSRGWRGALAVLLALGLLAAACGDDDGDGETTETTAEGAETTEAGGTETTEAAGEPVQGGSLTMGLEADTSSPWTPAKSVMAVSGHAVARAVYDPLMILGADGEPQPNLAASVEPNADYTVWTITAREGVAFHDGTPFDGAAIADNLTRQKNSFLTGKILADVASIEVDPADPMVATVTMSRPWVAFPIYLTGQVGYMASPTWLAAADADPALESQPVGTGPFVFASYRPGEGFRATRNPDYWREGLPYLDEIEFRFITDGKTRQNALVAGDIDIMHTAGGEVIAFFRERPDEFPMPEITEWAETGYTLLHVTQDGSPLTDERVRCALAWATDSQAIIDATGAGVAPEANGPYSPERPGYLDDTGFPGFDPEQARALIDDYEAENGPVQITYTTTTDSTGLLTAQLVEQYWEDAGVDVEIGQIEQGQFIVTALQGNFQAFAWRNHGGPDPDQDYIWWHSSTALPVGQLALNFGRIKDPVIDENLDVIHSNPDQAARVEAAENINRRFGEQCFNLWGSWAIWGIPHSPAVQGLQDFTTVDGEPAALSAWFPGAFNPQTLWLAQ